MRILIIHNFYRQPGGEDDVVRQELAMLADKGHAVELLSRDNDEIGGFWSVAAAAGGTIYSLSARNLVARRISEFKPDIVHVHNFFPLFSPSVFDACKQAAVPSVMTLHNFRILCPTGFLYFDAERRERSLRHSSFWTVPRRVYRNSFAGTCVLAAMVDYHKAAGTWANKVDGFIALTEFSKRKFVEGGIPAHLISVKGNFCDHDPDPNNVDIPRSGALFVGRLSPEKGVGTLLRAWEGLDIPLRMAGDGPLLDSCRDLRNDRVTVLGRLSREQVYAEMERAQFLVVPSEWFEMFGLVIVQANSCGLPVIASRLGGLTELVSENATGLFFDAGDPVSLRRAVSWAQINKSTMQIMGNQARAFYESMRTSRQNYEQLIAIYERVIAAKRESLGK